MGLHRIASLCIQLGLETAADQNIAPAADVQSWEPDSFGPCVSHDNSCAAAPQKQVSKILPHPWELSGGWALLWVKTTMVLNHISCPNTCSETEEMLCQGGKQGCLP